MSWTDGGGGLTLGQLVHRAPRTLGTVLGVFLLCNVFLLQAVFDEKNLNSNASPGEAPGSTFFSTLRSHFRKNELLQWRLADKHPVLSNEVIQPDDPYSSCSSIANLRNVHFAASGWTKSAYKAAYNSTPVAVKTVNFEGHDVTQCLKEIGRSSMRPGAGVSECYMRASAKILKEIYLLSKLVKNDVGIIKMLGYCVPEKKFSTEDQNLVSIMTELGEPFDVIRLLQMSWEERLGMTLDLSRFLHYLSHSPLGDTLRVNDFRRQQFVLVKGHLKLSDLDDVTLGDPVCDRAHECSAVFKPRNGSADWSSSSNSELRVTVPCVQGLCQGLSEKLNIVQAGRHFVNFILPHGVPIGLKAETQEITEAYLKGSWNTTYLLKRTEDLVRHFATGQYRKNHEPGGAVFTPSLINYKRLADKDQPGVHDYHCRLSLSGQQGCTLSVVDAEEAAQVCSSDIKCQAFVLTNKTTWTGRRIAHFKNGSSSSPVTSLGVTLYVKKS